MAIDDLLDEHEQSEKVRTWLRENALGLIGGVALGFAAIGGWQWWQQQQQTARAAAGERYQAAVDSIQANKLEQARAQVAALDTSTFAALGALQLAKAQVAAGQSASALTTLRNVHTQDPALAAIATRRLVRLMIDAGKNEDALKLLPEKSLDNETLQLRGDAYHALGKRDQARDAYMQALVHMDADAPQRRLVELKLSEVGGTPPKPEAKT